MAGKLLSDEEWEALDQPSGATALSDEDWEALPAAPAKSVGPVNAGEAFGQGVARMMGGRYIMPAVTAGVKALQNDSGQSMSDVFKNEYNKAQDWYDAKTQVLSQAHPVATALGETAGIAAPSAGAGTVFRAVPLVSRTRAATGLTGALGRIGASAVEGAAIGGASVPYSSLMRSGTLPDAGDVTSAATLGAVLSGGLGAAGEVATGVNHFRPSAYRNPKLSANYGTEYPSPNAVYRDFRTVKGIKESMPGGNKQALQAVLNESDSPILTAGSVGRNEAQRNLSAGMVESMNEAHPGTAGQFAKTHIKPQLDVAVPRANTAIKLSTGGVGTPTDLAQRANALDKLYQTGISKLKGGAVPEAYIKEKLAPYVGETVAENVVSKGLVPMKGHSVYTSGVAEGNVPLRTIAQYVGDLGRKSNVLNYESDQQVIRGLAEILAESGNPEFTAGLKGWRNYYDIIEAYNAGKAATSLHSVDDINTVLNGVTRSSLSADMQQAARGSGFLSNVKAAVDNRGTLSNTSRSVESVIRARYPVVANALDNYSYWQTLSGLANGQIKLSPTTGMTSLEKIFSKAFWGRSATAAKAAEETFRHLAKNGDRYAAESLARLLTAKKSDINALMEATTYRSNVGDAITKMTPAPTASTIGAGETRDDERKRR